MTKKEVMCEVMVTHKDDFNNVSAIVSERWMAVCVWGPIQKKTKLTMLQNFSGLKLSHSQKTDNDSLSGHFDFTD